MTELDQSAIGHDQVHRSTMRSTTPCRLRRSGVPWQVKRAAHRLGRLDGRAVLTSPATQARGFRNCSVEVRVPPESIFP